MTRDKHRILLIAAAFLAAFFLFLFVPQTGAKAEAASTGIDVSMHQGAIDWNSVAASGIKFAMIRCGDTQIGVDPFFAINMVNANKAGIRCGVYWYSRATTPAAAVAEAMTVVNMCANYTVSFPIAIDYEAKECLAVAPDMQAQIVNAFSSIIYNAGYYPMVYASKNWFLTRMGNVTIDHWVAQYNDVCEYPNPAMWQYTSHGSVPGISTRVDMDQCLQDYFTLIKANGWDTRNGKTYYYSNYKRLVGAQAIDGKHYMFNADGSLYTGLYNFNGVMIYFSPDAGGALVTGWQQIDGGWFYFSDTGALITNCIFIDGAGVPVQVDANGLLVAPAGYTPTNGVLGVISQ